MIEYQEIGEPLLIHFESKDLDMLQVGILTSALHEILNQVAITILNEESDILQSQGENRLLDFIPQSPNRQDVLVRARIVGIREGSIEFYIQPLLAQIFSEPSAIAILQNLVANTIWAIGAYGKRVVGSSIIEQRGSAYMMRTLPDTSSRRRLRPRVENLIKHLKDTGNGGRIEFRSGDEELIVELYPPDTRRRLR